MKSREELINSLNSFVKDHIFADDRITGYIVIVVAKEQITDENPWVVRSVMYLTTETRYSDRDITVALMVRELESWKDYIIRQYEEGEI